MGLQIRRKSTRKINLIVTLVAAFALVAQPMYGLVASQVANAISNSDANAEIDASTVCKAGNVVIKIKGTNRSSKDASGTYTTSYGSGSISADAGQTVTIDVPTNTSSVDTGEVKVDVTTPTNLHYIASYAARNCSTVTVGSTNADFTTIQEGIDNVTAGGTVSVKAGTYSGNVTINKSLTISGGSGTNVIGQIKIDHGANDVTLTGFSLSNTDKPAIKVPSEISLDSLTLSGMNIDSYKAIYIGDGNGTLGTFTIENSTVTSNYPVYIDHPASNVAIKNNTFNTVNGTRGVVFANQAANSVSIKNNTFDMAQGINMSDVNFVKYTPASKSLMSGINTNNHFTYAGTNVATMVSSDSEAIVVDTRPGKPQAQSPDGFVNTVTPTLKWAKADNADYYQVQISTKKDDFHSDRQSFVYDSNNYTPKKIYGTSKEVPASAGLKDGVTYYWHVRARNSAGVWSSYGSVKSFTVDTTPPTATINGKSPVGLYNTEKGVHVHAVDTNYDKTVFHRDSPSYDFTYDTSKGSSFNVAWMGDGEYTMTVYDKAGNSKAYNYMVDGTNPTADLSVKGGHMIDGTRHFRPGDNLTFTVSDPDDGSGSGVDNVRWTVFRLSKDSNGKTTKQNNECNSWTDAAFVNGSVTRSFNVKTLCKNDNNVQDGSVYGLAVRVYDNAGNYLRITNYEFSVDGLKPVLTNLNVPTDLVSKKLHVSVEAKDQTKNYVTSGVTKVQFWVAEQNANGECKNNLSAISSVYKVDGTESNGVYSADINVSGLNGNYCLLAQAEDGVMNHNTPPLFRNVTIDNTAPVVTVTPQPGSTRLHDTTIIKVTVTDENLDANQLDKLYVHIYKPQSSDSAEKCGHDVVLTRQSDSEYTGEFTVNTNDLKDGDNYRLSVANFMDLAGNNARAENDKASSGQEHFAPYIIDNTGPTMSAKVNNAAVALQDQCTTSGFKLVGGTINLSAGINDGAGVDSSSYKVVRVNAKGCIMTNPTTTYGNGVKGYSSSRYALSGPNGSTWTGSFDTTTLPSDGIYAIEITSKDGLGNKAVKYIDINVDNTAPDAPLVSPKSGTAKGTETVTVAPQDKSDATISKVTVSAEYDGNKVDLTPYWTTVNSNEKYTLDTSELYRGTVVTVTATAKDKAGNTTDTTVTYTVKNDAPTLKVNKDTSTSSYSHTLTGTVDPVTTLTTVTVNFLGTHPYSVDATIAPDGSWSLPVDVSDLGKGYYSYTVTASDGYGNSVVSDAYQFRVGPVDTSDHVHHHSTLTGQFAGLTTTPVVTAPHVGDHSDRSVLGAQDDKTNSGVLGDTAALTPSAQGWKVFGVAWYWWLFLIAVIAALWAWLAARRRQEAENN